MLKSVGRRQATVERAERALRAVISILGNLRLSEITTSKLLDYAPTRMRQPGRSRGTLVSAQTVLNELHALSSLFESARAEGIVTENAVRRLPAVAKPRPERKEAVWLEGDEAARLLRFACGRDANPLPRAIRFLHPLLATYLYTGGRKTEVFGLEKRDVDLARNVVHFRPNEYRRLKCEHHARTVPLWPDLDAVLRNLVQAANNQGLLFPSTSGGLLTDIRGSLSAAVADTKIGKEVTTHTLRHTYAATRIQTLDHGAPVSPYTVMRELGHRSLKLIEETYGHLQDRRNRSEFVEYREAQILELSRQDEAQGSFR